VNEEGVTCGNRECKRLIKKDKGFYAMGHHIIVCSDGCEQKLWEQYKQQRSGVINLD